MPESTIDRPRRRVLLRLSGIVVLAIASLISLLTWSTRPQFDGVDHRLEALKIKYLGETNSVSAFRITNSLSGRFPPIQFRAYPSYLREHPSYHSFHKRGVGGLPSVDNSTQKGKLRSGDTQIVLVENTPKNKSWRLVVAIPDIEQGPLSLRIKRRWRYMIGKAEYGLTFRTISAQPAVFDEQAVENLQPDDVK